MHENKMYQKFILPSAREGLVTLIATVYEILDASPMTLKLRSPCCSMLFGLFLHYKFNTDRQIRKHVKKRTLFIVSSAVQTSPFFLNQIKWRLTAKRRVIQGNPKRMPHKYFNVGTPCMDIYKFQKIIRPISSKSVDQFSFNVNSCILMYL